MPYHEDKLRGDRIELEVQQRFGGIIVNKRDCPDLESVPNWGTLEVKADFKSSETNNIAIEVKGNLDQPSGLSTTLALHWMQVTKDRYIIFSVPALRAFLFSGGLSMCKVRPSGEGAINVLIPKPIVEAIALLVIPRVADENKYADRSARF